MLTSIRSKPGVWFALLMLALAAGAGSAFADPPSRVARLSVLRGDVSYSPAGEDDWRAANLNRPLVSGDQLYTDRDARAELDIGAATVRMDERSSFTIRDLDDRNAQLELTQGTLNLHVHKLYGDQRYEVDTPTLAFVISQPGEYRIDIDERGAATRVTVFDGAGTVFGAGGTRYRVDERQSYRFNDTRLRDVAVLDLPRPDDFDDWCFARDDRYDNSLSRRYVSDEMIGVADLDEYGDWDDMPSYGSIWYPTRVDSGWAPYRSGHWAWIDPWGWTWVDNAPWGFAPFHYGRWVYAGNRWGWLPGPVAMRPVYAPALVVFIGGNNWYGGYASGGAPVGWCPLGPRDVYVPPYSVSHGYFTQVNTSNTPVIDRDHINHSYENYAHGRPARDRDYAYRNNPAAVTAVSRETFVRARPVEGGRLRIKDEQLAHRVNDVGSPPSPTADSRMPDHARVKVPRENFHRDVVAHRAAPAAAAPFAKRVEAIERNGGRPLGDSELQRLNARQSAASRAAPRQRGSADDPEELPAARVPATVSDAQRSDAVGVPVAPRDRTSVDPERSRDRRSPLSENPARQAPEAVQRVERFPQAVRAVPAERVASPRDEGRNAGYRVIERAPPSRELTPVEPRNGNDSPARQADTARADDRRASRERDRVRERVSDNPPPVERPQPPPAAAMPQQPSEAPPPHGNRHVPPDQPPAPEAQAPAAGSQREQRNKNARHAHDDGLQEQYIPGQ